MVYNEIGHEYVEVITTGATWAQEINKFYSLLDHSKLGVHRKNLFTVNGRQAYELTYINDATSAKIYYFSYADGASSTQGILANVVLASTAAGCLLFQWALKTTGNTFTSNSGGKPPAGTVLRIYY